MKKIVAIPIQSAPSAATGGTNLSVSPMKTLKTSESPVLTQEIDNAENNDAKRRKTEKGGKGLR